MFRKPIFAVWVLVLLGASLLQVAARGSTDYKIFLPVVLKPPGPVAVSLGDVPVVIDSQLIPEEFISSNPTDAEHLATAFTLDPFQSFSVSSVKYGEPVPTEGLPPAVPGGSQIYREILASFRVRQGGTPAPAPAVSLFGQNVVGSYSVVDLVTDSDAPTPTLVAEWVTESESRLWIVRVSRNISDGSDVETFLELLKNLIITKDNVQASAQSTIPASGYNNPELAENYTQAEGRSVGSPGDVPYPTWWEGDCDADWHTGSYRLSAVYNGLISCGPRTSDSPDGAWRRYFTENDEIGALEWECVELAKRYVYSHFGILPYATTGGNSYVSDMPPLYIGNVFERIRNGTRNKAPLPGDIISFRSDSAYGHVAVVNWSDVDSKGNGWITVIEQNFSADGFSTPIKVKNWRVGDSRPAVNWLHPIMSPFPEEQFATSLVSRSTDQRPGNNSSSWSSISADGNLVAFESNASTLVRGDANNKTDILIRDRKNRTTKLVSVSSGGVQANGHSIYPQISADGRYVVFQSIASNLVVDDNNGFSDIFIRDLVLEETYLVSISTDKVQGNGASMYPSISADGNIVVFESYASNLDEGDINSFLDVFVHERATGKTTRIATSPLSTTQADVSANGRYIAFVGNSLTTEDQNVYSDVYVYDRDTKEISLASVSSGEVQGNSRHLYPTISADGRYVAFSSGSTNLIQDDTNGMWDIFVRDTVNGETYRVSVSSQGVQANNHTQEAVISDNGQYLAMVSGATNLVSEDTNGKYDVFVHDINTQQTYRVSLAWNKEEGNGDSTLADISADGRYVSFASMSTFLVPEDTNPMMDVFVYDTQR